MVSWVVKSLFLSAVFGAVFCESPEIQVVENLIATSNKLFRDRNLTEIKLPDIGWIFEPVQYREGRLGQFDTLELISEPEIVSSTDDNGTLYTFNLSVALRDLSVKYKFHVNVPFFGNDGNVTTTVREKSFEVVGRVLVKNDGTCFAILQDAKVGKFGDFKVDFEPDDAPLITQMYQAFLNIVHQQLIPIINLSIREEINQKTFKEDFNKYVCDEVTRNSTTEAPSPTTDQPEPSSRRPHHPTTRRPHHPTTRRPHHPTTRSPHHSTTKRPHHPTTYHPHTHRPTRHPHTHRPTRRPHYTTTVEPEPETTTYEYEDY